MKRTERDIKRRLSQIGKDIIDTKKELKDSRKEIEKLKQKEVK